MTAKLQQYRDFLARKTVLATANGFAVREEEPAEDGRSGAGMRIESLAKCRQLGHTVSPIALFMCTTPGFMCEQCNGWMTLTRREFAQAFGKPFGQFMKHDLDATITHKAGVRTAVSGTGGIFISGRHRGLSGCSADRRKARRKAERARKAMEASTP